MDTFHQEQLDSHCRVCSKPLHKTQYHRECCKFSDILNRACDIECDNTDVCPKYFCAACYQRARRITAAKDKGIHYESSIEVMKWTPHSLENCCICNLLLQQRHGGRPRKEQKKRG